MGWLFKVVGVGVAATVIAGAGIAYGAGRNTPVVERVIDGDTLDLRLDGQTMRVRLLNVDTPETKDPDQPVECLGPEATEFLEARLPAGTRIDLVYDVERHDRYGRTLAGVFESGRLVNAEIAAAGLGAPVLFEPNRRFYNEVVAAAHQAEADQVGAYDPTTQCSLPAQTEAAADQLVSSWLGVTALTASDFERHDSYFNIKLVTARSLLTTIRALRPTG